MRQVKVRCQIEKVRSMSFYIVLVDTFTNKYLETETSVSNIIKLNLYLREGVNKERKYMN